MYSKMIRCYVAGALNSDAVGYIQNMHRMIKCANQLRKIGVSVYVPCNDFLEGIVDGGFTYTDFFNNSQAWLLVSNCMFVCPGYEKSEGTKREIELAGLNGIEVFYRLIDLKEHYKINEL
jgi:hypothetical protein